MEDEDRSFRKMLTHFACYLHTISEFLEDEGTTLLKSNYATYTLMKDEDCNVL